MGILVVLEDEVPLGFSIIRTFTGYVLQDCHAPLLFPAALFCGGEEITCHLQDSMLHFVQIGDILVNGVMDHLRMAAPAVEVMNPCSVSPGKEGAKRCISESIRKVRSEKPGTAMKSCREVPMERMSAVENLYEAATF